MCMIDNCDGFAVVLHSRQQRARITHRCTECRREIGPGETYLVERTVFEGEATSHKFCAHCQEVRAYLLAECSGFAYGQIEEDIREHWCGDTDNSAATREVRRLALGMAMEWRRADGRLWPLGATLEPKP
jgi:hypothetical protein